MSCDAKIRPFPNPTEIFCEETGPHTQHAGTIRDYAYEGSVTRITWFEMDRRNYHGAWPGDCVDGCILPKNHHGKHVS